MPLRINASLGNLGLPGVPDLEQGLPGLGSIPAPVPFNPDAPNPFGGQGLPIPQGFPQQAASGALGAPQQPGPQQQATPPLPPTDLSDLSPLQKGALKLRQIGAAIEGRPDPKQELIQQRQQAFRERQQDFLQSVEIARALGAEIQSAPISRIEEVKARQRAVFEKLYPDRVDLFDATVGDPSLPREVLDALANDDAGKFLLYTGTIDDVLGYAKSPEFRQQQQARADQRLFPEIRGKVGRLFESSDPAVREALRKAASSEGIITPTELLDISRRLGTDGPQGYRLTPEEEASLERQQGKLAELFPAFGTTESFAREEELRSKEASKRRQLEDESAFKGAGSERKPPTFGQIITARNAYKRHTDAAFTVIDSAQKIETALAQGGGIQDIAALYGLIRNLDPESVVREGEINLTQQGLSQLSRLQLYGQKLIQDRTLTNTQRREILELTRSIVKQVSRVQTDYETNTRDLADRFGIPAEDIITRSIEQEPGSEAPTEAPGEVQQRRLKNGETVNVRRRPDGSYEEVP